ncbi:UNVERIFIED_CONTAM: site-specific recombinase XerD [Acetivibrio alkalicellulosi]
MASIEKRGENSYRIVVNCGSDSKGKRLKKSKSVTLDPGLTSKQKEKELQRLAALFEDEVEKGTYLDAGKISFEDFCEKWLSDYAEKELEPKTVFRYKEMLQLRIYPAMGHIKLNKIQPTHLLEFYNNLSEAGIRLDSRYTSLPILKDFLKDNNITIKKLSELSGISEDTVSNAVNGKNIKNRTAESICRSLNIKLSTFFSQVEDFGRLSSRTILHHHRLISAILSTAVHWQFIFNNPAARVKAPKTDKSIIKHYDENQTKQLLKALDKEDIKYKTMVLLDVFSGLRIGELMGLSWDNIDLENNTIEIIKTSQYLSGKGNFEKNPKNKTSVRKISIPVSITSLLKEYRLWWLEQKIKCGDLWQGSDRLFVTWNGKPMFTYTLTNWFPDFLNRHNLPKITPHGLRHTSATLLAAQGLEVSAISKRLGHARTSTTMDIYVHALKSADIAASEMLEKALIGSKSNDSKCK